MEEKQQTAGKDGYALSRTDDEVESPVIAELLSTYGGFARLKNDIIRDHEVAGNVFIEVVR